MRHMRYTAVFILSAAIIASVPGSSLSQLKAPAGTAVTSPSTRPALPPKVAYAGTTLECGNKSYHVTSGSNSGRCVDVKTPDGQTKVGVVCKDTNGNYAGASCGEGCYNSTGSGDCTKQ